MTANSFVAQAPVLPIRGARVCLVLSTNGKRWGIPKGRIERRHTAGETALQEAWEEAGLVGVLRRNPVGSYRYQKCGKDFHVTVFFMMVSEITDTFPEDHRRLRRWVRTDKMLRHISDPSLRRLLRRVLAASARFFPLPNSKFRTGPCRLTCGSRKGCLVGDGHFRDH